jgi:hypothetical protein
MATITFNNPKFDTVEYIKRLRNAGATQELAEIQAQELDHVISAVFEQTNLIIDKKELATKQDLDVVKLDLQKEIKSAEITLMFLMGAGFASILGVLAKGFHWF